MAFPALPSDWFSRNASQKLAWFISKGVTADDLTKMGEAPGDIDALVEMGLPTGPGVLSQGTAAQQQAAVQEAQAVSDSVAQQYEEIDNNNRRVEALAAELGLPSFVVAGQVNAGLTDADIRSIYGYSEPVFEDTRSDPRESLTDTASYSPPVAEPTRNLGPGITLANPLTGVTDFGTKTVTEASGDTNVDVTVPQTVVDYLIANNPTIADSLAHSSTFVKTYRNVNGKLEEVDASSITPQDAASGNVIFQIGGKTGGPDRERVAQIYVPRGDKLEPVGEASFYKGEHPDQGLFDAVKMAAVVAGVAYGLPALLEAGTAALGGAAAAETALVTAEAGIAGGANLTGAAALGADAAGLGSLGSNLTIGEAAGTIANPASIITKPVVNTVTDYIVQAINSNALAGVEMLPGVAESAALSTAQVGAIKTAVAAAVNGAASELMGGDFAKGAAGTIIGTALNSVVIPGSGQIVNDITGDITDPTKIKDLTFNQVISSLVGTGDVVTGKLNTAVTNAISSGLTTTLAGGTPDQIVLNTGLSFGLGLIGDVKIPGTKLTGDDAQDLIVGSFDAGNLDAASTLDNSITVSGAAGNDAIDPVTFILGAASSTGATTPTITNKKYNLLGKEWNTADALNTKKELVDSLKDKHSIEDIRNAMLALESNITEDEFKLLGLSLPDSLGGGAGNDTVTVTGGALNDGLGSLIGSVGGGGGNDTITGAVGNDKLTVTATRESCLAQGKDYDPALGCVDFPSGPVITGGGGNDKLTVTATRESCLAQNLDFDPVRGCVPFPSTTVTGGGGNDTVTVRATRESCLAQNLDFDPVRGCVPFPSTTVTGGGGNDIVCGAGEEKVGNDCKPVCKDGEARGADGICRPSVKVTANCATQGKVNAVDEMGIPTGGCACPPGTTEQADGTCKAVVQETVTGGGGNDVVSDCPAGYKKNATTGECEIEVVNPITGIIGALQDSGNKDAGYNPNLKQPWTASRTYTAPPEDYDYYEDPYFQRFGPITYAPPAGYEGAGKGMAEGGLAGLAMAQGGRTLQPRYLGGITDGMADKVPANIDGQRPAALSDGEFVIPADVVSHLGNGNSSAGAKVLYEMIDRIRKARTGTTKQGRQINPNKFMPR